MASALCCRSRLLVASSIKIAGEVQDSTTQMGATAATNMNPPNPQGGINNNINSNAGTTGMQLDQWRCRLQKPDSSTLGSHHSTQTTGMLTFSAVNGESLAEQWRLQSETMPRPPNYTIALPALLGMLCRCSHRARQYPTHPQKYGTCNFHQQHTNAAGPPHIYIYRQLSLMQVLF